MRCVASRYCETSTRSAGPRRPSTSRPRLAARRARRSPRAARASPARSSLARNNRNGSRNTAPISAAHQPVRPFPPEDGLELGERHPAVELRELRDGLVLVEFGLPRGVAQRRQRAGDRLPLDDREAGLGEPRRAADQHHREDQRRDGIEPQPDGALAGFEGVRRCVHACRNRRGPYRPAMYRQGCMIPKANRTATIMREWRKMHIRTRKLVGTFALLALVTMGAARDGVRAIRPQLSAERHRRRAVLCGRRARLGAARDAAGELDAARPATRLVPRPHPPGGTCSTTRSRHPTSAPWRSAAADIRH